jgi:pimeloyl-ACP methyl ester carboxylesterase
MPIDIAFARNGDVAIGYTIVGDGPVDLVYVAPNSNLEVMWESQLVAAFFRRLSSFTRLVVVDRRGTGVSDRYAPSDLPPLEDLVDDLLAVLDAVGSEQAFLLGFSDAGAQCAMLAATYPERVAGLVLYAVAARGTQTDDYPWQWTEEEWERYLDGVRNRWGTRPFAEESLALFAPSHAGDRRLVDWWLRLQRVASSPGANFAQERIFRDMDIRGLLPVVSVPTLVLHRTDDVVEPVGAGRYVAGVVPGARYVELPGADHWPFAGDQAALVAEVERFVADVAADHAAAAERVLATVLFTDVVDSTAQAAALGDRAWREMREKHDRIVRGQIVRHRGREVKTMGDGFLAVFDGPARAVRCARAICSGVQPLGLEVRAGLHTGEIELAGDDVAGVAVALGARVGALAAPGEVLVSSTVKDLVIGSGIVFEDRGAHELKGVPDAWRLYAAVGEG